MQLVHNARVQGVPRSNIGFHSPGLRGSGRAELSRSETFQSFEIHAALT